MTRIPYHAMRRRQFITAIAAVPAALVLPQAVLAGTDPISARDGIAIRGADTVAFFTDGGHVPGRPENALMWRGAIWLFDRAETMQAFEMDPLAYAPAFGGYCTYAMSHGMISDGDPRSHLLHEGGLYLCSNPLALAQTRRDVAGSIAAAQLNWPAVVGG